MAERRRAGLAGIYHATRTYITCTYVMLAAIQNMAARARASTPQTLARKRIKDYAPRTVAAGPSATSSDDKEVTVLNETGAPPASHGVYLHCRCHAAQASRAARRQLPSRASQSPYRWPLRRSLLPRCLRRSSYRSLMLDSASVPPRPSPSWIQ